MDTIWYSQRKIRNVYEVSQEMRIMRDYRNLSRICFVVILFCLYSALIWPA